MNNSIIMIPKKFSAAKQRIEAKAEELGHDFARSGRPVSALGPELFSCDWMPYRTAFGRGLARGAIDISEVWAELVGELHRLGSENFNYSVLSGFIKATNDEDRSAAQALLSQCRDDNLLRLDLVNLHPAQSFGECDLDRCLGVLKYPEVNARMFGVLLWRDSFSALPEQRLLDLAECLLKKPNGDEVVLDALSMKLHQTNPAFDTLGAGFRRLGLMAATSILSENKKDAGGSIDYEMKQVVGAAFSFEGNEEFKTRWLDAVFALVDQNYGYMHSFDDTIRTVAAKVPNKFLDRVFVADDESREMRQLFIRHGDMGRSPLEDIDVDVLIAWCRRSGLSEAWPVVAAGLQHWVARDSDGSVALSRNAIQFLEAAPNAEDVLRAYASEIEPTESSGDRVSVMENRVKAVAALLQHPNQDIALAVKAAIADASKRIEFWRQWEKQRDEDREQTFE